MQRDHLPAAIIAAGFFLLLSIGFVSLLCVCVCVLQNPLVCDRKGKQNESARAIEKDVEKSKQKNSSGERDNKPNPSNEVEWSDEKIKHKSRRTLITMLIMWKERKNEKMNEKNTAAVAAKEEETWIQQMNEQEKRTVQYKK